MFNLIYVLIFQDDWQKREQELLKKIADLEKVKTERTEDGLRLELKVTFSERAESNY